MLPPRPALESDGDVSPRQRDCSASPCEWFAASQTPAEETGRAPHQFVSLRARRYLPRLMRRGLCRCRFLPGNRKNGEMRCGPLVRRLFHEALRDRHPASDAERAACDLQSWNRLGPLVFVQVDAALHPANGLLVEPMPDDLGDAELLLDVELENRVENLVGRQCVLIALIRLQLGARRFLDGRARDEFAVAS